MTDHSELNQVICVCVLLSLKRKGGANAHSVLMLTTKLLSDAEKQRTPQNQEVRSRRQSCNNR